MQLKKSLNSPRILEHMHKLMETRLNSSGYFELSKL